MSRKVFFIKINMDLERNIQHSLPSQNELTEYWVISKTKSLPFEIFMEQSKAYDMLDHKILIDKRYYGITDISCDWKWPFPKDTVH